MAGANTLTIGVMDPMAQYEREVIGKRTRKALAEKKGARHVPGKAENFSPRRCALPRRAGSMDLCSL